MIACNKDKFTSEPQVKIKSISPETVYKGNRIELKGSFTDEEGDVDSVLIVQKLYSGNTVTVTDTFRSYTFSQLSFPKGTRSGDIIVSFLYGEFDPNGVYPVLPGSPFTKDTTLTLGLIVMDTMKHRSNFAESSKILLKKGN